jgi:hypothetical protein
MDTDPVFALASGVILVGFLRSDLLRDLIFATFRRPRETTVVIRSKNGDLSIRPDEDDVDRGRNE